MEILRDDAGRYRVTFNGTLYNACQDDFDCPGQLTCVRNKSWTIDPELCVCPLTLGRTGQACTENNASAWILIAISLCVIVVSFSLFIVNVHNLLKVRLISHLKERVPPNSALFTTMVFTTVACASMFLQAIYQVFSHFDVREYNVAVNENRSKQSRLVYFNFATIAMAFFFSICAALNISLALIEIADRVSKGNSKIHVNIVVYRKFLVLYATAFGTLLIVFAIIERAEWTFLLAAPATLFISVAFFIGWFRLSSLYNSNNVQGNKVNNSADSKIKEAVGRIRRTALGVSICTTGLIICGILQFALDSLNRPDGSYAAIPGRLFWVFAVLALAQLTYYTYVHIHGKLFNSRKQSSNGEGEDRQQALGGATVKVVVATDDTSL